MFVARIRQLLQRAPSRRAHGSRRPGLEVLEGRLAPNSSLEVWTGGGADTNWSTAANWSLGRAPRAGDDLVFPSGVPARSLSNVNNLTAGISFNSLTFSGSGYDLSGNKITLASPSLSTTASLVVTTGVTSDLVDLDLQIGTGATPSALEMTVTSGSLTLAGHLGGVLGVGLTKEGAGTLVLANDNSGLSGAVTVSAGALQVGDPNALGTTSAGTTVLAGAQLQVANPGGDIAEPLTLNGTLRNVSGDNTWAGPITLTSNSAIGVDGGTSLIVTGDIKGGAGISLSKVGVGSLFLDSANDYLGPTLVQAGVLNVGNAAALGGAGGAGTSVAAGATLQVQGNTTVSGEALTLAGSGVNDSGALDGVSGNNTWAGPITLAGTTFLAADAGTLTVSGVIGQAQAGSGLAKTGSGVVALSGQGNTYTGPTQIDDGTFGFATPKGMASVHIAQGTATVLGTTGNDVIAVSAGSVFQVNVNGVLLAINPANVTTVKVEGNGGSDSVTLSGRGKGESAILSPNSGQLVSTQYAIDVDGVASITVTGTADESAFLYDSPGNDTFAGTPTYAYLKGTGFYNLVSGFGTVSAYASQGNDQALFYDSPGKDRFGASPTYAWMQGPGFKNLAQGFANVAGYSSGGSDAAYLYDSPDKDTFTATPAYASLKGGGYLAQANGFSQVTAYGTGNKDLAYLYDSAGKDTFAGTSTYSYLQGSSFDNVASGFARVYASSTKGGGDVAYLYGTTGKDTFVGTPGYAYLQGAGAFNQVSGFATVTASSGGGSDLATLYDSAGKDTFIGTPTYAYLQGSNFKNVAFGFAGVTASSTKGGGDVAYLYDSTGNDVFAGTNTSAYLKGSSYNNRVNGFRTVTAYASGHGDQAYLYGSGTSADTYASGGNYAELYGGSFTLFAVDFGSVYANPAARR